MLYVETPNEAADAVRAGRARLALASSSATEGLTTREIEVLPVALLVPLTFPVEGVSTQQARDIVSGRATNWQVVGGPALPLTVSRAMTDAEALALRAATGEDAAAQLRAARGVGGQPAAGTVELRVWDTVQAEGRPPLGTKPLLVDSLLPWDPAYPLAERRVLTGAGADLHQIAQLGDELRRRIEAMRPVEVTLDAVGDIMLGREVGRLMAERGPGFPFEHVRSLLASSDIRFGNLELPLTDRGTPAKKDYVFRAPPTAVAALVGAGFNVVSLANNHALDYGAEGLLDTLTALDRAGIARMGAGRTADEAHAPAVLTVKGLRIAFLAYTNTPNDSISGWVAENDTAGPNRPGVAWGTAAAIRRDVAAARQRADLVVVALHSGFEYTSAPNTVQRELAKAAVDAGAALVLGGHPHVLQGVEFYKGAPIIYSLGNFVFDLDADDRRQPGLPSVLTVIFRVTLSARGVTSIRFLPTIIDQREGRPIPVTGADARPVLDRLYRLTDALN
jgi:poly-gamma-glutamate synthesis protein (capsule biosynthesis protein)